MSATLDYAPVSDELVDSRQEAETTRRLALAWVNDIRAGHGLQPLDDFPPDAEPIAGFSRIESCPVAQALVYYKVGVSAYAHKDRAIHPSAWEPLPGYVRQVISWFDAERDLYAD